MPRKNSRGRFQLREGNQVLACALLSKREVEERNEWGAGYAEKGQVWRVALVSGVGEKGRNVRRLRHEPISG